MRYRLSVDFDIDITDLLLPENQSGVQAVLKNNNVLEEYVNVLAGRVVMTLANHNNISYSGAIVTPLEKSNEQVATNNDEPQIGDILPQEEKGGSEEVVRFQSELSDEIHNTLDECEECNVSEIIVKDKELIEYAKAIVGENVKVSVDEAIGKQFIVIYNEKGEQPNERS